MLGTENIDKYHCLR